MKKTYLAPATQSVKLECQQAFLEESIEDTWGQAKVYHRSEPSLRLPKNKKYTGFVEDYCDGDSLSDWGYKPYKPWGD